MSSNVEDEIVSMQFDNRQFESGVATSLSTIDKLKSSLQFQGATNGLSEINRAAQGFSLNPMANAIQGVNKLWLGMTTVAVTAIGNITNRAVDAGIRMTKALTLDPISEGFQNYETKINAVQTILANTADQGTKLKDVTGTLNELNKYANQTVYNFSEMARNIGTFTAAGVNLKDSTSSIKGIANLAALSGSTSAQASQAMYQLSQAIAAGQVHLQDWNSVVTAGIGGAVFQRNLIQAALATGTLDKSQVHLGKTMADTTINGVAFRQSLTPPPGGTSWLTSGVLTKSLGTFTGDLSKAQLVAEGFTKEQAKALIAQGKRATNAATKIKTFTQLFQALKEEVGTAYASVFEALFGNINQAKKFLSPLHSFIENALTQPIYSVATALKEWRKAGGFDDLVQIFKNLGTIVGNLLYPFKELFGSILPSSKNAGKGLEGFTKTLAEITGWVAKATSVTHKFDTVLEPVKKVFGILTSMAGAFLDALKPLLPIFSKFASYVRGLFNQGTSIAGNLIAGWVSGLDPKALQQAAVNLANSWIAWIKDALGIHSPASTMVPIGLNIIQGIVEGLATGARYLIVALQKIFIGMGKALKFLVTQVNWGDVGRVINEGLFIAIALAFRGFIKSFTGTVGAFKGLIGNASEVLEQLTSNLKTMQNKVRSEIIRNIAISVGILAASAFLLSKVNGKKLAVSLGAIAGMMTSLLGVMYALGGGGRGKHIDNKAVARQTASLFGMSTALIAFSTAVLILVGAVALMGQLKPETIKKGLEGVAGVITLMVAATAVLSKSGGGATILATAVAMNIMAAALITFVGVMKLYQSLDWKTLVQGGGSAAAVIVAIGLAMRAFSKGSIGGATGLIVASAALVVLAKAMQMFAAIGLGDMIKSVIALDFILGSLAIAAEAMSAAEGGAASMLVMAGAIFVLAQALKVISKIPLLQLGKAIIAIALAIVVIAGTAAALSELSPLVAALGGALLLLGGAIFLAGVGVLAFATAMGILAVVGPAAFQAIHDGIDQLLEVLPQIGEAMAGFVVGFLTGLVQAAGPLVKAIVKLVGLILDGLTSLIPKGQKLVQKFINAIIETIVNSYTRAAKAMIHFVVRLLEALGQGVPKMIKKGTELLISLIEGFSKSGRKIINAIGGAILSFLVGVDNAINKYETQIIHEGEKIALDFVAGFVKGLVGKDAAAAIGNGIKSMGSTAINGAKSFFHIGSPSKLVADEVGRWIPAGLAQGITANSSEAKDASQRMGETAFNALKDTFSKTEKIVGDLFDLKPKVTPVLDLSHLHGASSQISNAMGRPVVNPELARRTASDISNDHAARHHSGSQNTKTGDTYNFNQTNNSPKPLNPTKVYRNTKSQIALFREVTGR